MNSDCSYNIIQDLGNEAETARERSRRRARERREAMSTEEREAYLAQRRNYYRLRRARLANEQRQNMESNASQLQTWSQFPTSAGARGRLARFIPLAVNVNPIQVQHLCPSNSRDSVSSTANQTSNVPITRGSMHRLSRSVPVLINANSFLTNPSQPATSHHTTTHATATSTPIGHVGKAVGRTHLTHLPHNPFTFNINPRNYFESSTSYANNSNNIQDAQINNIGRQQTSVPIGDVQDASSHSSSGAQRVGRTNHHHNIARDFHEGQGFHPFKLPNPTTCCFCRARLFHRETKKFCCKGGKTILPEIHVPAELFRIFTDGSAEGRIFRHNLRAYNHVFSFTSIGVQLDDTVTTGQGVYAFRAHGSIYHKIGTLIPPQGIRPRYLQMFIYDTEHETENRLQESSGLNRELLDKIKRILNEHNPFVKTFRQLSQRTDLLDCKLLIKERPASERQYTLPTASQVAAVISGGEELDYATNRDIVVETIGGQLMDIKEFSGFYDPLQYPILHPYGTYGWDSDTRTIHGTRITCCDYYAYMMQIRINNPSILLYAGRLLQQYVVDNYVKIETQKLRYIRSHQDKIRAELYQGLQDCLDSGENNAGNVGRRTVLPSSFVGSPQDMYQRYRDAMAIVQKFGKPDIFLTMTCNTNWQEIQEQLLPGQTSQDRPDLLTIIFRAKYEELKKDIYKRGVLGKVVAHVHVIEFQKRGLPHVHMLVILHDDDKLNTPDDYDHIVRAEIPNREEEPKLYEVVIIHMIHGPCGAMNQNAPCMKNNTCKKDYPKNFAPCTIQGNDSYPVYRRRDDNRCIALDINGEKMVDNRWVVPYNPWLLLKYDCHINVEICSSIKSIKYLYKYVYKGPDCAVFEVRPGPTYDEVSKYVDGRWICAPEALWKMYKFPMSQIYPSVVRLQLHLPNMQQVQFYNHQSISEILNEERNSRTMLTEFFRIYNDRIGENKYLYREFTIHYRWLEKERVWQKRRTQQKAIGRIYAASPHEGERFYMRILLTHVTGPKSFDDLLTVNGVHYLTFKQVAEKRGLLEEDDSLHQCLIEARNVRLPYALRRLFATILIFCEPTGVRRLWDENYAYMIEDYPSSSNANSVFVTNKLLHDIKKILSQHKRSLKEFDLPQITEGFQEMNGISSLIADELTIPISTDEINNVSNLNSSQLLAFNTIKQAILNKQGGIFFVDGPGGTGKTFLYRALLAAFRNEGHIMIAIATSGIAANQLPGGRNAHSRLKIPIKLDSDALCRFSKQSELCQLLDRASAIIWDEAPMANRKAIETVDRTLRDMLELDFSFAGKIMISGGDFRQVVPVVVGGTRSQTLHASIVESNLWSSVKLLHLAENIRAQHDQNFSDFVLRVGNGEEPVVQDDMIRIPNSMAIPWKGEQSSDELIASVYPNLGSHTYDAEYMMNRALITPLNDDVNKLNARVIERFPGEEVTYYSYDSLGDDMRNLYLPEFLNSLSPGNFPPHKLTLKKGCPIMLLRNIDPKIGLCNGTRLICHGFGRNVIDAEILAGQFKGTRVFLPRIPLKTPEDIKFPFEMTHRQFPVRLSFELTINKSQGQTIPHVGIYLPDHVFSHGQLYVALSRGVSEATTKVLVKNGKIDGHEGVYTRNVVYPEIFAKLRNNYN